MGTLRASAILAAFFAFTVPLMPVQALLVRVSPLGARRFPNWYHKKVCRLLGIRVSVEGSVARNAPVLVVANHTSWLDIPVLSAVAPVSFVAKKEVGGWPFVASLARLQRTVFIDRTKRQAAGEAANEIMERLAAGDAIVLFAEGTSSDGNRVLPFKTSLFGAVKPGTGSGVPEAVVQTASVVYTHVRGIPLGRADRPRVGWYGDMEMPPHAWRFLKSGPIDVMVKIGAPVLLEDFSDRKDLALKSEQEVRRTVLGILRYRPADAAIIPVEPPEELRKFKLPAKPQGSEKWT
jgi:1-acyl-sn-glycerol-3-phosphate acyltransferase